MRHSVGRYVFGLAAIGSGICALTWHQFGALSDASLPPIFIYVLASDFRDRRDGEDCGGLS